MNDLTVATGTTSMQIANVVGKLHHHVMRDIKDEIKKLESGGISSQSMFGLSERTDSTGRRIPYFTLTKEGVLQLAARYDAVIRAKLIELAMKQDKPQSIEDLIIMQAQSMKELRGQVSQLTGTIGKYQRSCYIRT